MRGSMQGRLPAPCAPAAGRLRASTFDVAAAPLPPRPRASVAGATSTTAAAAAFGAAGVAGAATWRRRLGSQSGQIQMAGRSAPRARRIAAHVTAAEVVEKTPLQTQVEEMIALRTVVMISKTTCPFCAKAKEAFQKLGYTNIAVVELDKLEPAVAQEIQDHMLTLTGARTVPRVFINKKFVGGGTDISNLAASGELKKLVEEARQAQNESLRGDGSFSVEKSDEDWKKELGPGLFKILRQRGTEPPGSHEYDRFLPKAGHFGCAGCGLPLYSASSKFASSCGWPVFNKCYHSEEVGCHVGTRPDGSGSLEILCPRCGSHLGHVFFDAHSADNSNGERH